MNRNYLVKLLNGNGLVFSIGVFQEAAKLLERELTTEVEDFIKSGLRNPMYSDYILDRYNYCINLLIKHFQVNSIKNLQTNQVIKYY